MLGGNRLSWRRGIWTTLVAAGCAWLVATCVYDGIKPIRIVLVPGRSKSREAVCRSQSPLPGQACWALIARIRHAGTAPQLFVAEAVKRRMA